MKYVIYLTVNKLGIFLKEETFEKVIDLSWDADLLYWG
jgi:hypothetical protein